MGSLDIAPGSFACDAIILSVELVAEVPSESEFLRHCPGIVCSRLYLRKEILRLFWCHFPALLGNGESDSFVAAYDGHGCFPLLCGLVFSHIDLDYTFLRKCSGGHGAPVGRAGDEARFGRCCYIDLLTGSRAFEHEFQR